MAKKGLAKERVAEDGLAEEEFYLAVLQAYHSLPHEPWLIGYPCGAFVDNKKESAYISSMKCYKVCYGPRKTQRFAFIKESHRLIARTLLFPFYNLHESYKDLPRSSDAMFSRSGFFRGQDQCYT